MILTMENHKDPTRRLPDFITEFGKAARYKMNMPKFLEFLYTNNEWAERDITEMIPLYIT